MVRFLTTISIPIMLVILFTGFSTTAVACAGSGGCCKKEVKTSEKSCCKKANSLDKTCKDHTACKGSCGDSGCPCPQSSCTSNFQALASAVFVFPNSWDASDIHTKADWYFLNKIPAAVYLSVWLPPKI